MLAWMELKEREKIEKYQELARELQKIRGVKTELIPVVYTEESSKRIRNTLRQNWTETLFGTGSEYSPFWNSQINSSPKST